MKNMLNKYRQSDNEKYYLLNLDQQKSTLRIKISKELLKTQHLIFQH